MDLPVLKQHCETLATARGWPSPTFIKAGASGAVFRLEHPAHGLTALKIYDPQYFEGDNAVVEVERLVLQKQLAGHQHPSLVTTIEVIEMPVEKTWAIIMEFCPWPDLSDVIAKVPNILVPSIIDQLAKAVAFLDGLGLVHRDIKPANIAISQDFETIKLLDFGVLRKTKVDEGNGTDIKQKHRFVATAQYSPPEYIMREEAIESFDALNIYQIGATLHDLIMKRSIFAEEAETLNRYVLFKAILEKTPTVFNNEIPARLNSVCRASLIKDPAARVQRVTLDDFYDRHDDLDTLRRRLQTQSRVEQIRAAPRLAAWKPKVRAWVASAARAERAVLGPYVLANKGSGAGPGWTLTFDNAGLSIDVLFKTNAAEGVVRVMFVTNTLIEYDVLSITADGLSTPEDLVVDQLREQLLVALDSSQSDAAVNS